MSGVTFPFQKLLSVDRTQGSVFISNDPAVLLQCLPGRSGRRAGGFVPATAYASVWIVYRAKGKAEPYVIWGGLSTQMTWSCTRRSGNRMRYTALERNVQREKNWTQFPRIGSTGSRQNM